MSMVCEHCKGGHSEDKIILCDKCDKGWHMFCLSPPLENIPNGDWICPSCMSVEFDVYAFQEGDDYSFEEFEETSIDFERRWWGNDAAAEAAGPLEREREFWRVVEAGEEAAEVLYGADLDALEVGSAFLGDPNSPYASSPWNLHNLPRVDGAHPSLLRYTDGAIAGVTHPWVYVGMLFSSFAWHVEDHMFYSINYNCWGAPKHWYGVPGHAAGSFEAAFRAALPDQLMAQPDLLFQLLSMLSPRVLVDAGVPVVKTTQEAGTFIITFPNAYHCGFSMGLNCGEAVNFASPDWLRFAAASSARYRLYRKPCVISQEEIILRAALDTSSSVLADYHLSKELRRLITEESILRAKCWHLGIRKSARMSNDKEEDGECHICHLYLHLSSVQCSLHPNRSVCLHHADLVCDCPFLHKALLYRHSLKELEDIASAVEERTSREHFQAIEAHEERLEAAVERASKNAADVMSRIVSREGNDTSLHKGVKPEPGDDNSLEELAGFMTEIAQVGEKRKLLDPDEIVTPISGRTACVVDSVVPYSTLDIAAQDEADCLQRLGLLAERCELWFEASTAALKYATPSEEVGRLAIEAEEYLWGGSVPIGSHSFKEVESLAAEIKGADTLIQEVQAALKGKPTLEQIEAALRKPKPRGLTIPGFDRLLELLAQGTDWLARNKPLLESLSDVDAPAVELRTLELAVNEATRLPLTIHEAKILRERLQNARKVADAIRAALPSGRESGARRVKRVSASADETVGPATIDHLKSLQAQVEALNVEMPESSNLSAALERFETWMDKARGALECEGERPKMSELRILAAEADLLPAGFQEAEKIRALLESAEYWLTQRDALVKARAPLKKLRDHLHQGFRLPIAVPEVDELKQDISKAEWEERARKALQASKHSVASLQELLMSADEMGAEATELAGALRKKIAAAEVFDRHAEVFLSRVEDTQAIEAQRPSIEELQELVLNGKSVGVTMDKLITLTEMVSAATKWISGASDCLPNASHEDIKIQSSSISRMPGKKGFTARLEIIESLLDEYDMKLAIRHDFASELRELRSRAQKWLERAYPILYEQDYVTDDQLPLLNDLIQAGKETCVGMEQLEILEANVEALHWAQTVRALLSKLPPLPPISDEACVHKSLRALPSKFNLDPIFAELIAGKSSSQENVDDDDWPTLDYLIELEQEGDILPCDESLLAALKHRVELARQWESYGKRVLTAPLPNRYPEPLISDSEVLLFIEAGKALRLKSEVRGRLLTMMEVHKEWEHSVREILDGSEQKPLLEEFQVVESSAKATPITSVLRKVVDTAVADATEWLENCRKTIAKKNTGMRLDKCLEVMRLSIDSAIEQFERRLDMEKKLVATAEEREPDSREDEHELYCLCQQSYNVDAQMIACDACGEWFHFKCVGLTHSAAKQLKKYSCPVCSAVRGNLEPLDAALTRLKKTKRAQKSELVGLLSSASRMTVSIAESEELEKVLMKFDRWATATQRAIEVHELSHTTESNNVLPLSDGMLYQLCKSALSIEVDSVDYAVRVMKLLRVDRWRKKVSSAVIEKEDAGLPSLEVAEKLLAEGVRLGANPLEDAVGRQLCDALSSAKTWIESSNKCLETLQKAVGDIESFKKALVEAKELEVEAQSLKLDVLKHIEQLRERAKLFCLCKEPYDEQRSMLSCDYCNDWFHPACMGLNDGDLPQDFRCPECCIKACVKYPFYANLPEKSLEAVQEILATKSPATAPLAPVGVYSAGAWPYGGMSMPLVTPQGLIIPPHMMMNPIPGMFAFPTGMILPGMAAAAAALSKQHAEKVIKDDE